MLGAIIGDVIGSRLEKDNVKSKDFDLFTSQSRFTDDTVLTIAVAEAILNKDDDYQSYIMRYGRLFPLAGYGKTFKKWLAGLIQGPYNSWGNGSAMRVSPVGWAFSHEDQVLLEAKKSAEVTHNHPEGVKGAQAIAIAIYYARNGKSKLFIKSEIENRFGYDLSRTISDIRPAYEFDVSCQGSVPEAIIAFLESVDFEDAIRTAISIGGDSDTIACMCGSIAEAFYRNIPDVMIDKTVTYLPEGFQAIIEKFREEYILL